VPELEGVYAELARLEAESEARRNELRAIAAQLPAALSRRALLRSMATDLRTAPNKPEIAWRLVRKLVRAPRAAVRRLIRGRAA
jgi:hypothetical protein